MSEQEGQDDGQRELPVVGLQGKPVLYPPGPWEAAVDDRGRLVKDEAGRLLRVR